MDIIDTILTRGVDTIYPSKEAFEKILRSGKKLRLYQGFDPTGTQLHIGHMVGLMKLAQFQEAGHKVVLLIGDGTGQAGDPSGKTESRTTFFTNEELRENAKDYVLQAKKILRFDGENPVEVRFNGDWLNKLNLRDLLTLFGHFTIQQLLERDIFDRRIKEGKPVNLREFIYPLLQGYDSVALDVDLEIGGTDQTFNMLTGRYLVQAYNKKEKFVLTLPILADSSGRKIGKSEGNVIALTADPNDLYGMIMNLPDSAVIPCFEYITKIPLDQIETMKKALHKDTNPMEYKKQLAYTLVEMLNSKTDATKAQEHFEFVFQNRNTPQHIDTMHVSKHTYVLVDLLTETKLVSSKSEAKRLIAEGAVKIDDTRMTDPNENITITDAVTIKVGKRRFIKVTRSH